MKYPFLVLFLFAVSCIPSSTYGGDIEQLLSEFDAIQLGIEEADFKATHPNIPGESIKISPDALATTTYRQNVASPLFNKIFYQFEDGKLVSISLIIPEDIMAAPNPEIVKKVMKYCKSTVMNLKKMWGTPDHVGSVGSASEPDEIGLLAWQNQGVNKTVMFTSPRGILAQASSDGDPPAYIYIGISKRPVFEEADKTIEPSFDEGMLEGDYDQFISRAAVSIDRESSKLMPNALKDLYIGMSRDELARRRPRVHFGTRFDQGCDGTEPLQSEIFNTVGYNTRQNRLVALILNRDLNTHSTAAAAWCTTSWGEPDLMVTRSRKKAEQTEIDSRIFVWHKRQATTALKIYEQNRSIWEIVIFEKNLALDAVLPHPEMLSCRNSEGAEMLAVWGELQK